jgi:hypothetical protein
MTIAVYFLTIICNFFLLLSRKKSKVITFLSLLVIILLMSGTGSNYNFPSDYFNYFNQYQINSNGIDFLTIQDGTTLLSSEIGMNILMSFGNLLNLDFEIFRFGMFSLCIFIIYCVLSAKFNINHHYVLLFYLTYPIILDSEQLSNFIALTLLIIGFGWLLREEKLSSILFIFFVLLASLIHSSFIVYIPLIAIKLTNKKYLVRCIVFISILLIIATVLNNNQIPYISLLINNLGDSRSAIYLVNSTRLGYFFPILLFSINFIMIFVSNKLLSKQISLGQTISSSNNSEISQVKKIVENVYWIYLVSIIYIPLFIMNINFYRLIRNYLLVNIVVYSLTSRYLKNTKGEKWTYNVIAYISIIIWGYIDLVVLNNPSNLLLNFFTNNSFFN